MPSDGVPHITHTEILRFEEILRLARVFAKLGITRFKITGGEPFVRGGVMPFLAALKDISGVSQVTLTTNGVLLKKHLPQLANIGIDGVNISLDTLNPDSFRTLTGFDALANVLDAIHASTRYGLRTKINTVLMKGINEDDVVKIAEFARENVAAVRFIELMPVGQNFGTDIFSVGQLMHILEDTFGKLEPISPDKEKLGNGPAAYYRVAGFSGKIGLIPAMSSSFCQSCNRIRLTSDGFLKLCLSHDNGIDLRLPLRDGSGDADIASLIEQAVTNKPELSGFDESATGRLMHMIGG